MCEPLLPIDAIKDLRFSVGALASLIGAPGSYERELAKLASTGIERRIDWIIANLEKAGEGKKNFGVGKY